MRLENTAPRTAVQPSLSAADLARIEANAARLSGSLREMFFNTRAAVDFDDIARVVADFVAAHPENPPGTRRLVAVHEAGHAIGFEATGTLFLRAEVTRINRRSDNWIGEAFPCDPPCLMPRWVTPDGARKDALFTLAGPIAEELFDVPPFLRKVQK